MSTQIKHSSWTARDAWRCLLWAFVGQLFGLFAIVVVVRVVPDFIYWLLSPEGAFVLFYLGMLPPLVVILWFTRTNSVAALLKRFDLLTPPGKLGLAGILFGVGLGILGVYVTSRVRLPNSAITARFVGAPTAKQLYLVGMFLTGPFVEELIMRGFLYRAFRNTYGFFGATTFVLLVAGFTHMDVVSKSLWGLFFIMSVNLTICCIRERSRSLWDCILCHVAYNGVLAMETLWVVLKSVN